MNLGPSDEKNGKCLKEITDFLKDNKTYYLLWLVHGFLRGPEKFQFLQKSYVDKYQTDDIDMLVAAVNWNKGNLGRFPASVLPN